MQIYHITEQKLRANCVCSSPGKSRNQAANCLLQLKPWKKPSQLLNYTWQLRSSWPSASPEVGRMGPCEGPAASVLNARNLLVSDPCLLGERQALLFCYLRRRVKLHSCFLPWRLRIILGFTCMSVGY